MAKRSTALVKLSMVFSASPCSNAMLDMSFQNDLSAAVQCGFRRVDLGQRVLIHHAIDRLHLPMIFFSLLCRFSEPLHCFMRAATVRMI